MTQAEPQRKGVLELLDFNSTLKTPNFQRSFAWETAQINEFWNDLKGALDRSGGPVDHFLGLIVVDTADEIQDGQQRLATTLLLASSILRSVEAAKTSGTYTEQVAVDASAHVTPALRQNPSGPLIIGAQDQGALLSRAGIRSDAPESAKRLSAARKRLDDYLDTDLKSRTSPDAKLARLESWGRLLREHAYVILLNVPPKEAHNIFETLNTRGLRLSNGDLVKSHLVSRSNNTALAVTKWNAVTNALKNDKGAFESDLESFLLHYYGSRYKRTTKSAFFADYRSSVAGLDPLAALDELSASAILYRMLADPAATASSWTKIGGGTQQAIELLNGLNLKQLRYLLLAVLRDLGNAATAAGRKRKHESVLKIAAWSVRGLVHGQTGGGDAERTYIRAATGIRTGVIKNVTDLRQHFLTNSMLIASDKEFETRFAEHPFDREKLTLAHARFSTVSSITRLRKSRRLCLAAR